MKLPSYLFTLAASGFVAFGATNLYAQNRGTTGTTQQNQAFGATNVLGNQGGLTTPSPFGQQTQGGGTGQTGQFGNPRQNVAQPQVGGQDGFVGNDAQQMQDRFNARNANQQRGANFDFDVENLNDMRESSRQRSGRNERPKVHVKLRPLFTLPRVPAGVLNTRVQTQWTRSLPEDVASSATVNVENGTAKISGSVASDYEKRLAAKLAAIQPGITQVENNLTVEQDQARP